MNHGSVVQDFRTEHKDVTTEEETMGVAETAEAVEEDCRKQQESEEAQRIEAMERS